MTDATPAAGDAQSVTAARLLGLNPPADTDPDPATAHVGDVWAMPDGPPRAYLNDPHLTGEDEVDPHPWMQVWPPVPVGELRWYRTKHLPAGLRLVLRGGQTVPAAAEPAAGPRDAASRDDPDGCEWCGAEPTKNVAIGTTAGPACDTHADEAQRELGATVTPLTGGC